MLVKEHSKRLPGKNTKDFNGKPMFIWNLEKCLRIFDRVYVSSDSYAILKMASVHGAIAIHRGEELCGDVPDIPVYQHALKKMGDVPGIIAVHANNPRLEINLISTVKKIAEMGVPEVMTAYKVSKGPNYHAQSAPINGSIRAISRDRLLNYGDPYHPQPEVLVVDDSIEIETQEDFDLCLSQS